MKQHFFLILIFSFLGKISAQDCLPDGVFFTTQTQIDNFQSNYPGCTQILGDVFIQEEQGIITNLNGLSQITSIEGNLSVGFIEQLPNLTGLDNLAFIGGDLTLGPLPNTSSLSGIENLNSVSGNLIVYGTNTLPSFGDLENIISVGGDLIIDSNSSLITLNGLNNVTFIGKNLIVSNNDLLQSLSGLDNITSIGGELNVLHNAELTSLNSLDNVTSIGGRLWVENNASLTNLSGLDNIDHTTITKLYLKNSSNLSICSVQSICNYLTVPNTTAYISGNAFGCNSESEIEAACLVPVQEILPYENGVISIFPNPTQGRIQIEGANLRDLNVRILNLVGELIESFQLAGNRQIDISHLSNGLYFLELRNNDLTIIEKIVKE